MALIRPRRRTRRRQRQRPRRATATAGATATRRTRTATPDAGDRDRATIGRARRPSRRGAIATDTSADAGGRRRRAHRRRPTQWRGDDDGQGNRRRRRRRRPRPRRPHRQRAPASARARDRERGVHRRARSTSRACSTCATRATASCARAGYLAGRNDVYVSASQVRRFGLRKGDYVKGATRPPASSEKYPALVRVDVDQRHDARRRAQPCRASRTSRRCSPTRSCASSSTTSPARSPVASSTCISPIGKGQRGLIVSPPKAGKTTIIKQIVYSIERNNPEMHVMVLLVDERPEEVTDMRRHVLRAEVVASTFDRPSDEHSHVAELTIERAKRLVEMGKDVVIVLDGITRLARAYNLAAPASGRIMSGGVDSVGALPAEEVLRCGPQHRRGRLAHDPRDRAHRDRLEDGRGDLRGVQGHRQHGAAPRPRASPSGGSTRRSTSSSRAPGTRSCSSTATSSSRSGSCAGCSTRSRAAPGLELLIDKLRTTKSNDEFLAEIAKAPPGMAQLARECSGRWPAVARLRRLERS